MSTRVLKEQKITVLIVEQRVSEVLKIADRAIVLQEGICIRESDQPTNWLEEGALDDLFFSRQEASG